MNTFHIYSISNRWASLLDADADVNQLRSIIKMASIIYVVIKMNAIDYDVIKIKMSAIDYDVKIDSILIILS